MDINGVGQKTIEEISADSLWLTSSTKEKEDTSFIEDLIPSLDTAASSELEAMKAQIEKAQEPGRAAYLESIKAAIANDEFDVSAKDIVDGMSDDYLDFILE